MNWILEPLRFSCCAYVSSVLQAQLPVSAGHTQQRCQSQWRPLWRHLCCGRPEGREATLLGAAWRRAAGQAVGRAGAASLGSMQAFLGRDYHPWGDRCCVVAIMAAQTRWHPQSRVRAVCTPLDAGSLQRSNRCSRHRDCKPVHCLDATELYTFAG